MAHDHGWPVSSFDEENSNRYQPNAPLVVYCGLCGKIVPGDEVWAEIASGGDEFQERILLAKINRWRDREVLITAIKADFRGRIELEFIDVTKPPQERGFWGWLLRR